MSKFFTILTISSFFVIGNTNSLLAQTEKSLFLAYPPNNHQTTSNKIFLIGNAPEDAQVLINNYPVERSKTGNFAPSVPLNLGTNQFTIRYKNQEIQRTIIRTSSQPVFPAGLGFATNSLSPNQNIARLPGESICFSAVAPTNSQVSVQLGNQTLPLLPQGKNIELPPNSAVLNSANQPIAESTGEYKACVSFGQGGNVGVPIFQLQKNNQTITESGKGNITILAPTNLDVVEVTAEAGVARTGPTTDHSRLTPLPKGTQASVTGREGNWLRLDYGAWILASETRLLDTKVAPRSLIRSVTSRQTENATEIIFPLQVPVPVSIKQEDNKLSLTLYNATAQTDTIRLDNDPVIQRLDWQPVQPNQIKYTFLLKSKQQWGYDLRYEGTSLILSLRHPPQLTQDFPSLKGATILLDAGHGGKESGAIGPTGYPEKQINLLITEKLAPILRERGAVVHLTRETDVDVSLGDRVNVINKLKPTVAISIHYNSLPDGGDAIKTKGVSTFWYNPQAQDLAMFLQTYLVKKLNRPSYGVYWNNLALTRPHTTPTVLLELGFMINPQEFEWITSPADQEKLVNAIADGITEWLHKSK